MLPRKWKNRIKARYVVWVEAFGFAFLGLVAAVIVGSAFYRVPVELVGAHPVTLQFTPRDKEVKLAEEVVLGSWLVEPRSRVAKGQPILRFRRGAEVVLAARVAALADGAPAGALGTDVAALAGRAKGLLSGPGEEELAAPEAGILLIEAGLDKAGVVAAKDQVLARVRDHAGASAKVILAGKDAEDAAAGQKVDFGVTEYGHDRLTAAMAEGTRRDTVTIHYPTRGRAWAELGEAVRNLPIQVEGVPFKPEIYAELPGISTPMLDLFADLKVKAVDGPGGSPGPSSPLPPRPASGFQPERVTGHVTKVNEKAAVLIEDVDPGTKALAQRLLREELVGQRMQVAGRWVEIQEVGLPRLAVKMVGSLEGPDTDKVKKSERESVRITGLGPAPVEGRVLERIAECEVALDSPPPGFVQKLAELDRPEQDPARAMEAKVEVRERRLVTVLFQRK